MLTSILFALLAHPMTADPSPSANKIDRKAVVSRHNVHLTKFEGELPIQVGNGEFAFGMDITGLQTFAAFNTMSQWGWHSFPPPAGQTAADFQGQVWDTHGRPVRYPMPDPLHPELSAWLAGNPHRINLGRIGFILKRRDGIVAIASDLTNAKQTLDLWNGVVTSQFEIDGDPVTVTTACHPSQDTIAAKVDSSLIKSGRLAVFLDVPGDNGYQFANYVGDWIEPATLVSLGSPQRGRADFVRQLDSDSYHVSLGWQGDAEIRRPEPAKGSPIEIVKAKYGARDKWLDVTDIARKAVHNGALRLRANSKLGPDPILGVVKRLKVTYIADGKTQTADVQENDEVRIHASEEEHGVILHPTGQSESISFSCAFSPKPLPKRIVTAETTFDACEKRWPEYWKSGGAIDLSGSTDPRWEELERRVVLSQYLMKVNEAGSLPPQESGLVNNGWYGRWHMEMVWWHATHWALWNRWPEMNKSLNIYKNVLPIAQKRAKSEGYLGARWPKCIGPDFREWPHEIHSLLIWQQPHPIFFAELDYRAHPTRETLEKWNPVVEATADFLASYAFLDKAKGSYVLGPPLVVVSENTNSKITTNPTFELGYWRFGLRTAQEWRKRMGLPNKPEWDKVLNGLSPLPVKDGVYETYEGIPDMWTKFNFEHPGLTGAFGLLPGDGVDSATMRRTLDKVLATWHFDRTWGWDFPMLAMCAARLGDPDQAIDFLMTSGPGFQFDERGLATGGPIPYFPANGGLLYAIAMLCAGWDGAPNRNAPGFPNSNKWKVRWEGLSPAP
jgi:hypothetical protein